MSIPFFRKPPSFFCSAKNVIISYKFHRFHNRDISKGELFIKLHWLSMPGNSVSFSNDHFLIRFGTIIVMILVWHSFLMDEIWDTMHMKYVHTDELAKKIKKRSNKAWKEVNKTCLAFLALRLMDFFWSFEKKLEIKKKFIFFIFILHSFTTEYTSLTMVELFFSINWDPELVAF